MAIALGVLGAFNLLVRDFARNTIPRVLIRTIDTSGGITHLALGNSVMAAGFDAAAFEQGLRPETATALNAGLGATSPVLHLMILREALRRDPTIKVVIYGFFDFQLSEPTIISDADLVGNNAASYYLEPQIELRYYQMSWRDRVEFEAMRQMPMTAERGIIWEKVELRRRALGAIGMPPVATDRFGPGSRLQPARSALARGLRRGLRAMVGARGRTERADHGDDPSVAGARREGRIRGNADASVPPADLLQPAAMEPLHRAGFAN